MREPRDMRPSKTIIGQSVTIIVLTIAFVFASYYALTYKAQVEELQMEIHDMHLCSLDVVICEGEEGYVDNKD